MLPTYPNLSARLNQGARLIQGSRVITSEGQNERVDLGSSRSLSYTEVIWCGKYVGI